MFGMIPLPYKLLAIVALIAGVFFYGYTKGSANADAKLASFAAEQGKQIVALEKKNSEISNKVVTEYVDRVNTIKEKEYVYRDIIKDRVPTQYDMSSGWVYTHDLSVSAGDADAARASDARPSGITDTAALLNIVSNYATCQTNAEQLRKLQSWITENKAAVDALAKEKKK